MTTRLTQYYSVNLALAPYNRIGFNFNVSDRYTNLVLACHDRMSLGLYLLWTETDFCCLGNVDKDESGTDSFTDSN